MLTGKKSSELDQTKSVVVRQDLETFLREKYKDLKLEPDELAELVSMEALFTQQQNKQKQATYIDLSGEKSSPETSTSTSRLNNQESKGSAVDVSETKDESSRQRNKVTLASLAADPSFKESLAFEEFPAFKEFMKRIEQKRQKGLYYKCLVLRVVLVACVVFLFALPVSNVLFACLWVCCHFDEE